MRKLCQTCKKQVPLEGENKTLFDGIISKIPHQEDVPQRDHIFQAVGCPACNNTGYKGRIGIFEAILTDENIENIVNSNPSEREIRKAAAPQGMLTMRQDGVIKILQGVTSLEELQRVVEMEGEE